MIMLDCNIFFGFFQIACPIIRCLFVLEEREGDFILLHIAAPTVLKALPGSSHHDHHRKWVFWNWRAIREYDNV